MDKEKLHHEDEKTDIVKFGFWIYLMTDLLMFAVLFAAYAVLRDNNFGGITIREIFNPPFVLGETLLLLTSSFTCGLAIVFANQENKKMVVSFLTLTLILGLGFLSMEFSEFAKLFGEGQTPQRSAFLSSFFTLTGTHGLHIIVGCFWIIVMLAKIVRSGLSVGTARKLTLFSLFWHFLDIVWIFIFTIVYLMGGLS
ncbi:MAG TPA: cytochrome o ubiquinol oxidase subunit III [Patescibacteria group bacterium]|nr:cytochrome o ubiquinol oxidase subunit III [Patescibacteria group bacterium]